MKLPSPTETQLLAILAQHGELSGREVAKIFKQETGKSMSYGTLYTTFRRMKEQKWVTSRDAEDEDGRVRYFEIDMRGKAALSTARKHYLAISSLGLPTASTI
jgi:DNA-binding PadR family transcriptional regulator